MRLNVLVYTYLQKIKDGFPEEWRPPVCPHCNSERCFHHHGKRMRLVILWDDVHHIPIYRFKCKICNHTVSIIPSFLLPKQQASLQMQDKVLNLTEEGHSLNTIHESMSPQIQYSEKTLWRWKKRWQSAIDSNADKIWTELLKHFPFVKLPEGKEKPHTNNEWFLSIWRQLHDKRCFLEWVTWNLRSILTAITGFG